MTSTEMLHEVAAMNVAEYSRKLTAGLRGRPYMGGRVQVGVVVHYMKLWISMVEKGMNAAAMTDEEKLELKQAVNDRFEVHILREGKTLCGKFWPDYQQQNLSAMWVGFEDEKLIMFANCRGCLDLRKEPA